MYFSLLAPRIMVSAVTIRSGRPSKNPLLAQGHVATREIAVNAIRLVYDFGHFCANAGTVLFSGVRKVNTNVIFCLLYRVGPVLLSDLDADIDLVREIVEVLGRFGTALFIWTEFTKKTGYIVPIISSIDSVTGRRSLRLRRELECRKSRDIGGEAFAVRAAMAFKTLL
nr:hypothetical protein CFP56_76222 [Quercus suber]POF16344.1 hypothetical protein CFP56_23862 [Quercus suber]